MAIAKAGERDHGHEPRNGAVRLVYAGHQRALPISPSLLERSGGFFAAGSELRERVASGPLARPRRVRDNRGMAPRRALASIPAVLALGLAAACASTSPPPEPLAVGSALPEAVLDDQFGNEHRIDDSLKRVLLSRDMDGGRVVREVLAEHPDALQRLEAVYIADISGMPGVIASMMAIPKMRERPYPTLLDRDGSVTAAYPFAAGRATVIVLDAGRIERVETIGDVEAMKAALGVPPGR